MDQESGQSFEEQAYTALSKGILLPTERAIVVQRISSPSWAYFCLVDAPHLSDDEKDYFISCISNARGKSATSWAFKLLNGKTPFSPQQRSALASTFG